MAQALWNERWWSLSVGPREAQAWRGVEAQHVVATMKLVDSADEQIVLEQLLDDSKPRLPPGTQGLHYLLATPFRYPSPCASRFREAGALGIWYGAESVETACTELAYWGWRFLMDSDGLRDGELITQHSLFPARLDGIALDLTEPPWSARRAQWIADEYSACHAVARAARERGVQWIRYWSARHVAGCCAAVMDPRCLAGLDLTRQQTWHRKITATSAFMVHDADVVSLSLPAG